MASQRDGERWPEVYRQAPEVFDAFSRAEDPDGRIAKHLLRKDVLGSGTLLEIGCGTGRWTRELCAIRRPYVAIEPERGMLACLQTTQAPGVARLRACGQALPLAQNSFDLAFAGFVLGNLRPRVRELVLGETSRVLRQGGALWALENHGQDDLQDLRRKVGLPTPQEINPLVSEHGFEVREVLETSLEFPSQEIATDVLGTILGPRVAAELAHSPRRCFVHRVCLLRSFPNR